MCSTHYAFFHGTGENPGMCGILDVYMHEDGNAMVILKEITIEPYYGINSLHYMYSPVKLVRYLLIQIRDPLQMNSSMVYTMIEKITNPFCNLNTGNMFSYMQGIPIYSFQITRE